MLRSILSVVLGIVVAVIVFVVTETANSSIHPLPSDYASYSPEMLQDYYNNRPLIFWLIVLFGWGIGSLLCGLVIKMISKSGNKLLPLIAGLLLTLSAVANFSLIPHPTWFIVLGLLIFIPTTFAGFSINQSTTDKS